MVDRCWAVPLQRLAPWAEPPLATTPPSAVPSVLAAGRVVAPVGEAALFAKDRFDQLLSDLAQLLRRRTRTR